MERVNNQLRIVEDSVELKFPAMEYKFNRDLKNKVSMKELDTALSTKVDQQKYDELLARVNEMEETIKNVGKSGHKRAAAEGEEGEENSGDEEASNDGNELNLDGPGMDLSSPGKKSKRSDKFAKGYDSEEERKMEEARKKQEEEFNKLKETFEKFQEQTSQSIDELRKNLDE